MINSPDFVLKPGGGRLSWVPFDFVGVTAASVTSVVDGVGRGVVSLVGNVYVDVVGVGVVDVVGMEVVV